MSKLIEVKNLKKQFSVNNNLVTALYDINFEIHKNETLALVGESGSGKSLIAKILCFLEKKDQGQILYNNSDLDTLSKKDLIELRRKMQIIFQDPYASLNPRMKIRDIIGEPIDIHHLAKGKAKEEKIDELLEQVNLNTDFKDRYPHEFSGGQRQRIGIARALALNPEFIICDEPLSALDVSIQAQIINLLKNLQKNKGLTYLFISHDLSIVKYISHRVMVLYLGNIVEIGSTEDIYKNPLHPYTQALLSSIPYADPLVEKKRKTIILQGESPSIFNPPTGCPFHPRCPKASDLCRKEKPLLKEISKGRFAQCHLF